MADTLIREAIAYGSQPFSPVPQYWDGSTSYAKAQGINGALRIINYNSAGETFTSASPGSVKLTATSTVAISGTSTISVSGAITVEFSATGTVEILSSAGGTAYFSGANPGSVQLTATSTVNFSGSGTVVVSGTTTVNYSGTGTAEIVTSAGGTAYFSATNPAHMQLTATSTVNFSGSGTVVISGTSTVSFSGSNTVEIVSSAGSTSFFTGTNPGSVQLTATATVAISGTSTINFSGSGTVVVSGTSTVTFSGTETVAITGNITALNQIVGTQDNAWSASATVSAGATSNAIDLQYNYNISYFGTITNTASVTLNLLISQDNATYYMAATATLTAGTSSDFHYSTTTAARYAQLMVSGVSAIITATVAGK